MNNEIYNTIIRGDNDCLKQVILKYDKLRKHEGEERLVSKQAREKFKLLKTAKNLEKVYIKKNGETISRKVDHSLNQIKEKEILDILKKD